MQYGQGQFFQSTPELRIQQYGATPPPALPYQGPGSLKTNTFADPLKLNPSHTAQMQVAGPVRHASPPPGAGHAGSHFDGATPQTARGWTMQSSPSNGTFFTPVQLPHAQRFASPGPVLSPQVPMNVPLNMMPTGQILPDINAMDLTLAAVPLPPADAQLMQRLPSQGSLVGGTMPTTIATEEVVTTSGQPPTAPNSLPSSSRGHQQTLWVHQSAERGAAVRQMSARTRVASSSPSRVDLHNMPPRNTHSMTDLHRFSARQGAPPIDKVPLATEHQLTSLQTSLSSKVDRVHEELREMKLLQSKANQGLDTTKAVMESLKAATSVGDLRAGIRRAEETQIPDEEIQEFRDQLMQMERAEEVKALADESRRVEEKRRADATNATLMKDLERARQENAQVTQSMNQMKADARKEESARKQLMQERDAIEEERNKMKVRLNSLTQIADQKQMEIVELKKQTGLLKEENRDVNSKLAVIHIQHQQQADALIAAQSDNTLLRSQINKFHEQDNAALAAAQQETVAMRQKLQRSEALNDELALKSYQLEIKLRKANWSTSNPSPAEFVDMAMKREFGDNVSRQLAVMTSKNGELKTIANEYAARNEVLWKYIPADKENCVQRDLEAPRRRA